MKNLKYIVFAIIAIFFFNVKVGAINCTYTIYDPKGEDQKVIQVTDAQENYLINTFYKYKEDLSSFDGAVWNNVSFNYIRLDINDDNMSLHARFNDENNLLQSLGVIGSWAGAESIKDYDILVGESYESLSSRFEHFTDFPTTKLSDNELNIKNDACPFAIAIDFEKIPVREYKSSGVIYEKLRPYVAQTYYLDDYDNYDALLADYKSQFSSSIVSLIFPSSDVSHCMNSSKKAYDEVSPILEKFNTIDIEQLSYAISLDEGVDEVESNILNLDYFTSGNAQNSMLNDLRILKQYYDNNALSGDLDSLINCFNVVLGSDKGEYSDFNSEKLIAIYKFLDTWTKSKDFTGASQTISTAKKESDFMDEYRKSRCLQVPGSDKDKCIEGQLKIDIQKIDCDELFASDATDDDSLEKFVRDSSYKQCSYVLPTNDKRMCAINACSSVKDNIYNDSNNLVNKTTVAQQDAKEYIHALLPDLADAMGVEIIGNKGLCETIKNDLGPYIYGGLNLISICGPILTILLTAYDGIRTIASSKEDETKKFYNRLKIRLICVALLFLVPTIVNFLLEFVTDTFICKL